MRTIGSAFDLTPGGGAFDLGTTNGYLYNVQPGTLFADHFTGFERFAPDGERLERIEHFVGDTTGLQAWVDGKPINLNAEVTFELEAGQHQLTFVIDRAERSTPLMVTH